MDATQKTTDNNLLIDKTTTRALMNYLERQLGDRAKVIKANRDFTNQVTDISRIQSRISNLRLMSSEGGTNGAETQTELANAQRMLQEVSNNVRGLVEYIEA